MKSFVVSSSLVAAVVLVLSNCAVSRATAQEAAAKPAPALSYGSNEVLKLVRAKVGDDTVVAYIDHATSAYALSATDLIYLRSEGVSDKVLSAMLTRSKGTEAAAFAPAAPIAPPPPAAAPASYVGANPQPTQTVVQPAQVVVQPAVTTYIQAPQQVVVAAPVVYDYGYYPYYGYRYPAVSLSFGFGGGYRGGYRGGFHGGGFHGHR
ncbi:MAG: hypothetical protein WCP53_11365 [Verrucomicrobiota bacterium]